MGDAALSADLIGVADGAEGQVTRRIGWVNFGSLWAIMLAGKAGQLFWSTE